MTEVIQRERFEEFQKTAHLGRLLTILMGGSPQGLQRAEEELELAIYQTAWNPGHVRDRIHRAQQVADAQREERLRDARLLDKVASYGVDDAERPGGVSFPAANTKRPKLPGAPVAWSTKKPGESGESSE